MRGIHPIPLLCAYVMVALTPLGLAAWQDLPPRPFLDELSSGLAIVAFSMLLVEFVLSGRFRWVSGRIGIDITMRFHQVIARGLLVFTLIHPYLYSLPSSSPRPWDTSGQLTLGLSGASLFDQWDPSRGHEHRVFALNVYRSRMRGVLVRRQRTEPLIHHGRDVFESKLGGLISIHRR